MLSKLTLIVLALIMMVTQLAGCENSTVRVNWSGSSTPGHIEYHYTAFSGIERQSFHVEAAQSLDLRYDVTVEKGTLTLKVIAPDGESLWEETCSENASGAISLAIPQDGLYTVNVEGETTGGRFNISWNAEN